MDPHKDTLDAPPSKEKSNAKDPTLSDGETNNGDGEDSYALVDIDKKTGGILDLATSQELTRAKIALLFTQSFLLLVVFALATPFILTLAKPAEFPDPIDSAKNLVTLLASVLAGPFGFIVGFYYKEPRPPLRYRRGILITVS